MRCLVYLPLILAVQSKIVWEYHSEVKAYEDARSFCESQGLNLATIITAEDRANAKTAIGSNEAPYIDLYSTLAVGWWTSTGDCIDFWSYEKFGVHQPKCFAYQNYCALYHDGDDVATVDDIPCDTLRPFLCSGIAVSPVTTVGCEALGTYNAAQYIRTTSCGGYDEARQKCIADFGTDLATILTQEDMGAAENAILENNAIGALIGLNDRGVEGTFVWADGTCCTVEDGECSQFWEPGEPDNQSLRFDAAIYSTDADCVWLWPGRGGTAGFTYEAKCPIDVCVVTLCNAPRDAAVTQSDVDNSNDTKSVVGINPYKKRETYLDYIEWDSIPNKLKFTVGASAIMTLWMLVVFACSDRGAT